MCSGGVPEEVGEGEVDRELGEREKRGGGEARGGLEVGKVDDEGDSGGEVSATDGGRGGKDEPPPGLNFDPQFPRRLELCARQPGVRRDKPRSANLGGESDLAKHHDERAVERVREVAFCDQIGVSNMRKGRRARETDVARRDGRVPGADRAASTASSQTCRRPCPRAC